MNERATIFLSKHIKHMKPYHVHRQNIKNVNFEI